MTSQNQSPNYFAIIPADVRYCKELEPSAKLLYGEITALSNREGYCWASNAYFANLYDVDESTIKRWISSLSDNKFIEIDTKKKGMGWDRKIYIIQKSFTKAQKCPIVENISHTPEDAPTDTFQRRLKNEPYEGSKMSPYKDIVNSTKKTTTCVAPSIHEILKPIDIPDDQKVKLTSAFPKTEDIEHAIAYCQSPQVTIKTTLAQTLWWAAKEKPEIPKDPAQRQNENKVLASNTHASAIIPNNVNFEVLNSYVEVTYTNAQCLPTIISYDSLNFKEDLKEILLKYKIGIIS